jgi:hypothetical protein
MSIDNAVWKEDSYGCLNLMLEPDPAMVHTTVGTIHAFISKRPSYCDRGHYSFNVDGIPHMDGADSFPRYYMSLDVALREATDWLNWRMYNVPFNAKSTVNISVVMVNGSHRIVP